MTKFALAVFTKGIDKGRIHRQKQGVFSNGKRTLLLNHRKNHNHPSNGRFAQGLKATDTNPRLKARAFSMFKPYCICRFGIPLKGFVFQMDLDILLRSICLMQYLLSLGLGYTF